MLKKMMLLAMAVGALVALAGPASAGASEWDQDGVPLDNSTNNEYVFHGTLSSTKSGLKISCDATAYVDLWNDDVLGAHGEVTLLELKPDPTPNPFCTVAVLTMSGYVDVCEAEGSTAGEPWTITVSGDAVAIHGANFTNIFHGCQALGIPEEFEATETATAAGVTGTVEGQCIVFNQSPHFAGGAVIDGNLCATGTGLELTTTG